MRTKKRIREGTKRIFSLLLAVVLLVGMFAIPAGAEDSGYTGLVGFEDSDEITIVFYGTNSKYNENYYDFSVNGQTKTTDDSIKRESSSFEVTVLEGEALAWITVNRISDWMDYEWCDTSGNCDIAGVDITPRAAGDLVIKVSYTGFEKTYTIHIIDADDYVSDITLNQTEATVQTGETLSLYSVYEPIDELYFADSSWLVVNTSAISISDKVLKDWPDLAYDDIVTYVRRSGIYVSAFEFTTYDYTLVGGEKETPVDSSLLTDAYTLTSYGEAADIVFYEPGEYIVYYGTDMWSTHQDPDYLYYTISTFEKYCVVTVTGDPIETEYCILGDVNLDESVETGDALSILRHCVSLDTLTGKALTLADVTEDGSVTVSDALEVLKICVGLSEQKTIVVPVE